MIHYQRLAEIREEMEEKQFAIMYGDLEEEDVNNYESDISALQEEQLELEREQEDFREGYEAGRQFHMDGVAMREEWRGRVGKFHQGFDAAGQDS